MEQEWLADEAARLVRNGASEPGSPGVAALAEAHRRAGRVEEALRVAREGLRQRPDLTSARVALALALIDLDRVDEARQELALALEEVPDHPLAAQSLQDLPEHAATPPGEAAGAFTDLADLELDEALDEAQAEREEMIDANDVAAVTLSRVEENEPDDDAPLSTDSPFATGTVADLLERQGHPEEARALRGALDDGVPRETEPSSTLPQRERWIATLERWLENLRRESR